MQKFGFAAILSGALLLMLGPMLWSCSSGHPYSAQGPVPATSPKDNLPPVPEDEESSGTVPADFGSYAPANTGAAQNEWDESVPVFSWTGPQPGPYESLGEIMSQVHSTSCDAKHLWGSPEKKEAVAELRGYARSIGANGLIDLHCSVDGNEYHDVDVQGFYEAMKRWVDCVQDDEDNDLARYDHPPHGEDCDRWDHWPHSNSDLDNDWQHSNFDEPDRCEYTTECTAVAIKRKVAQQ